MTRCAKCSIGGVALALVAATLVVPVVNDLMLAFMHHEDTVAQLTENPDYWEWSRIRWRLLWDRGEEIASVGRDQRTVVVHYPIQVWVWAGQVALVGALGGVLLTVVIRRDRRTRVAA